MIIIKTSDNVVYFIVKGNVSLILIQHSHLIEIDFDLGWIMMKMMMMVVVVLMMMVMIMMSKSAFFLIFEYSN